MPFQSSRSWQELMGEAVPPGCLRARVAFVIAYPTLIRVAQLDATVTVCISRKTLSKTFRKSPPPQLPDLLQ